MPPGERGVDRPVDLRIEVVRATHHSQDPTGLRIHRDQGRIVDATPDTGTIVLIEFIQPPADDCLGSPLHIQIKSRVNVQASLAHAVGADLPLEYAGDEHGEMRRFHVEWRCPEMERFCRRKISLRRGDVPSSHHQIERDPLPRFGGLDIVKGIVHIGGLEDTCQQGRLGEIQLRGRRSKIGLGGRLDPEREIPPVDLIQEKRQDLILAVARGEPGSQRGLPRFALEGLIVPFSWREHQIAYKLLGNGAATGHDVPGAEVEQEGAHDAEGREAWILVECGIFGGNHCLPQTQRDIVQRQRIVLAGVWVDDLVEQPAIPIVYVSAWDRQFLGQCLH